MAVSIQTKFCKFNPYTPSKDVVGGAAGPAMAWPLFLPWKKLILVLFFAF